MSSNHFVQHAYKLIPVEYKACIAARREYSAAYAVVQSVPPASQFGTAWEKACERCEHASDKLIDAERAARTAFRKVFA